MIIREMLLVLNVSVLRQSLWNNCYSLLTWNISTSKGPSGFISQCHGRILTRSCNFYYSIGHYLFVINPLNNALRKKPSKAMVLIPHSQSHLSCSTVGLRCKYFFFLLILMCSPFWNYCSKSSVKFREKILIGDI